MSKFTPKTDQIRDAVSRYGAPTFTPEEFDRWLARIERGAAARAWDEGYAAGEQNAGNGIAALLTGLDAPEPIINPYRAAEIREGKNDDRV